MKDHITSLPNKLSEIVAEGGENFSNGQRQLICIARVLLRDPKVLVLDEATASIDNELDKKIQIMIRAKFKTSTVLTIAHRINTIIDSDRVMVLDKGKVIEFDTPETLLQLNGGAFKSLYETTNNK
jgi:ATP-binding cassette subfamily C (CFTR/MRP) protein 1